MRNWSAERIAAAAGARLLVAGHRSSGPEHAQIDSRQVTPRALFVGLPGQRVDGGAFAGGALEAGAWGVLVAPEHAEKLSADGPAPVLAAEDPLRALQRLATAWRRELAATVIGITGSTGKTSTKDMLAAVLSPQRRTTASRANFNTEIGLPLEILAAPPGTEVLVLEMAMRGAGQIAQLAAIAQPDVGVIVNIGPVHLELLGSLEAIAAAKAELVAALAPGSTAIVPADEPLLAAHLRADLRTVTFGEGGDVTLVASEGERVQIDCAGQRIDLEVSFPQAHLRRNLLAVVAAARAVGVRPRGRVQPALSEGRGQPITLGDGVTLLDDSYNANPLSMRAALDHLTATAASGPRPRRRVAVLGDMLELGPDERRFHAELGREVARQGIEVLVAVGPLAREIAAQAGEAGSGGTETHVVDDAQAAAARVGQLVAPEDVVLVKASHGVGLTAVSQALRDRHAVGV